MGITIWVHRGTLGDCTNNGASARHDQLTLVDPDGGPFNATEEAPGVVLVEHVKGCLSLVPLDLLRSGRWHMFGGNFGHSCDGRFADACEQILGHRFYGAVAIHDRVEG